jgi:heavy metal sensor kinase
MGRSIRLRLQLWYAAVLIAVVVGFAGLLYLQVRAVRLREADAQLRAAISYIEATLRSFPLFELEGANATPMVMPPKGPKGGPPPSRERLLNSLMPPNVASNAGDPSAIYFSVWRADGSVLFQFGAVDKSLFVDPVDPSLTPSVSQRGSQRQMAMVGPRRTRIVAGRSMQPLHEELTKLAWRLGAAGGAVLALGLAGGWVVSRRILRPIAAIAGTASNISAANWNERIDLEKVDAELLELARILNNTFDRLGAAFDRQARFTADASHELRTPLAVIRSHAELALARPRSDDEYRAALDACLRSATRMTAIVEGLLTLARADAGGAAGKLQPVAWDRVVAETVTLLRPLAAEHRLKLEADLAAVTVQGDPTALAQIATNLVDNAIRYNRPNGHVSVRLSIDETWGVLTVSDTGPGIPESDRAHLFERFYRVDKARTRATGGTGLGLAICKRLVELHGGSIAHEPGDTGGSRFVVKIPVVKPRRTPRAQRE